MKTFKQFIREWEQSATSDEGPSYTGKPKKVKWGDPDAKKEWSEVVGQHQAAQQDHEHWTKGVRHALKKLYIKGEEHFEKKVYGGKNKKFNWSKNISIAGKDPKVGNVGDPVKHITSPEYQDQSPEEKDKAERMKNIPSKVAAGKRIRRPIFLKIKKHRKKGEPKLWDVSGSHRTAEIGDPEGGMGQKVSARVIKADYQVLTLKQFINEDTDFDDIIGHAKSLGVHMKISKDSAGPTKKGHYWNLEHMKRTTGKPGTGSQSLQYAMKKADERNMPMYLQAGGDDWDSMHKLMDYYGKHGFKSEKEDSFEMWRKPGTKK